jgi:PhnB protein
MPKNPPEGYHSLNAYIAVEDANAAIEFYKQAFGAQERVKMPGPEGKIGHAELQIGDSVVMLSDPFPQSTTSPPKQLGGTTTGLMIYVDDADAVAQKAIDAGAELTQPLENMFWGDRFGQVKDPFGHVWQIATHIEDVPPEEMAERAKAAMASMAS